MTGARTEARTGPLNLLTDIAGVLVGHAHDEGLRSGVTAIVFTEPATCACVVLGGAPAGRGTNCLEPDMIVEGVDAVVLSGGSSFGLDATTGVEAWLREQGRGIAIGPALVPIAVQAILFDLLNGGDKDWGRFPPYRELGYAAAEAARGGRFELGTAGAGHGATTVNLKGGIGSASAITPSGYGVGALMAVNAIGSAVIGEGPHYWAAPFEEGDEFGGLGWPDRIPPDAGKLAWKGGPGWLPPGRNEPATTIGIVVTDATLDRGQLKRLAIAGNDGFARGLRLTHALFDGDTLFAASTGLRPLGDKVNEQIELGAVAADVVARAIARGVHAATSFAGGMASWRDRFGPA